MEPEQLNTEIKFTDRDLYSALGIMGGLIKLVSKGENKIYWQSVPKIIEALRIAEESKRGETIQLEDKVTQILLETLLEQFQEPSPYRTESFEYIRNALEGKWEKKDKFIFDKIKAMKSEIDVLHRTAQLIRFAKEKKK